MARKRWYAYSGIVNRVLSSETEITVDRWEIYNRNTNEVIQTFDSQASATAWWTANFHLYPTSKGWRLRSQTSTSTTPAQSRVTVNVPLSPLPVFARPGKVLTTRGFWDVQATTTPEGTVFNFAFGMLFMPRKAVFDIHEVGKTIDSHVIDQYTYREDTVLPDPLLDDPGFHAYESFTRVTTLVNQDPPFHSRTNKNFSENSVLVCVASVEVSVADLKSLRLAFGVRFRTLIEH